MGTLRGFLVMTDSATSDPAPAIVDETKAEEPEQTPAEQTQKPTNRNNKTQNQKKRKDTTVADLISGLPQLADVPSMRKELQDINRFGQKQRNPNVKQNLLRSSEIGLNLVKKYNAQNKQLETLKKNEPVYQQLVTEYQDTFKTYETLLSHLDGLVSQLT